ncbi:MAG: DUF4012 domain-containing protein [Candidatus Moranbacteria bacterium]|nr:DUF4012 domain-containing protein [Candidatus Moranbacteria bacterium]
MKKYSLRFWIVFWIVSFIFLFGWYIFLQVQSNGLSLIRKTANFLPITQEFKGDIQTVLFLADALLAQDGVERTYLALFQNNWELRPGGGFIGSFGIIQVKNGKIASFEVHDTANFDGRIPSTIAPPYPMKETLNIDSWKLRDSNYSPDFPTNVENAVMFYGMGGGEEIFDGVIAVTTNVLLSALSVTGPVTIEGYPGEYGTENAIDLLQYQVEKGYVDQNIQKGERKGVMNDLSQAILDAIGPLDVTRKFQLARLALENLHKKDIQLYFKDASLQQAVRSQNWDGSVDRLWSNDYLMLVDANLGAYKSDRLIDRFVKYNVDFSFEKPKVVLEVTYTHNAQVKDWKTNDYQSYLRIYTPQGTWLQKTQGLQHGVQYGETFGKKYFGALVQIPIGTSKTFVFEYELPESIDGDFYDIKIQKQAGIPVIDYEIGVTDSMGFKKSLTLSPDRDILLSEFEQK